MRGDGRAHGCRVALPVTLYVVEDPMGHGCAAVRHKLPHGGRGARWRVIDGGQAAVSQPAERATMSSTPSATRYQTNTVMGWPATNRSSQAIEA